MGKLSGTTRRLALAAMVSPALLMGQARAAPYSNPNFYFSMTLPDGLVAYSQDFGQDHGPLIALEKPRPGHCDYDSLGRSMGLFGYYNVVDEERTFTDFVKSSCTDKDGRHICEKTTLGLKIGNLKTAAFRQPAPTGKISILVLAQNRTGPVLACATGVNYNANLLTDPAHYEHDLAQFRRFLASVRTTPPPEDRKACEPAYRDVGEARKKGRS